MPFNLVKLDEKIAKLQEVRRIVTADPEMASLLAACLSAEEAELTLKPPHNGTPKVGARRITGSNAARPLNPNSLKNAVQRAVQGFGKRPYNVNDVFEDMAKEGFLFKAKNPKLSVGIEVRKLHADGQIELLERGSGSTPSTFRNPVVDEGKGPRPHALDR